MIQIQDTEIAARLASKYSGSGAFDREDAYQACIEGLLKAGVPDDEGLKVKVMRDEMHRQSVEASYLMRVPYSSWKRMAETPSHVRYTGLDVELLTNIESPSTAKLDPRMAEVEEAMALVQGWNKLSEGDQRVIGWATSQWTKGTRPGGKRFYRFKEAVARLREVAL